MHIPEMPFKIMAAAPFCGNQGQEQAAAHAVSIDKYSLKQAFQALRPVFFKRISGRIVSNADIQIQFTSIKDFRPSGLLNKCGFLAEALRALKFVQGREARNMHSEKLKNLVLEKWPGLPLNFPEQQPGATAKHTGASTSSIVDDILSRIAMPDTLDTGSGHDIPTEDKRNEEHFSLPKQLRAIIKDVLETVYADPDFKQVEECWRGIWFLVKQGKWPDNFILELLPVSESSLEQELESYFAECLPDKLPDLVLVDNPVDASPYSLELLEKLASIAEANIVPLAISLRPEFFHVESKEEIDNLPYLPNYIQEPFYATL